MEKFFRYLGHKAGPSIRKGKWIYHSYFADKATALESEYIVGRELAYHMRSELQVIENVEENALVKNIGTQLCTCVVNKERKFDFNIVSSKEVNAFALPGGFIFITDALLKKCHFNRDEIAFVLAHEMVHVVLRHPLKRILSNFSLKIVENVVRTRGAAGQFAKRALASFLRNGYSRENELEADKYGVKLITSAGFDDSGAIGLLNHLRQNKSDNPEIFNYFSSHPPIDERIGQIMSMTKK
jgi:predicted Zn-dependent protease